MLVRILRGNEIRPLLPMAEVIQQMRQAFGELSAGRVVMPLRSCMDTGAGDLLLMPACLAGSGLCVKAVLTYPGNSQLGLPCVQGVLLVFDSGTGRLRAIMDGEELTAIRTGAAGGLAVDLLSRQSSRVMGLIGAGVQARMQLEAARVVREIATVVIFDKTRQAAETLRDVLLAEPDPLEVLLADTAEQAVTAADIVVTATTSPTPTFPGRVLRAGTHVNAIGSYRPETRELDEDTLQNAYVVVDSRAAARAEAGDLILASREPDAELGELVNETAASREDDRQITVFKSVGVAVQDAVTAAWALNKAEQQGVGVLVDM